MAEITTRTWPRRLVAALVTLFFAAGAGHLFLGRYRRGGAWFAANVGCLLFISISVLLEQPYGLWLTIGAAILIRLASGVDVLRVSPGRSVPTGGQTLLLGVALIALGWLLGFCFRGYVVEAFRMPSGSMLPALQVGDHFYVGKLGYRPARGQIIVFKYPPDPEKDFVKRIVAVGGDTVQVCGGQVSINGQPLRREPLPGNCQYDDYDEDRGGSLHKVKCVAYREWNGGESYTTVYNDSTGGLPAACSEPLTVPPDRAYVLGDNRDNSHDSRYWGTVPYSFIKGKALFIWWSKGPTGIRWEHINQRLHHSPAQGGAR